MANGDNTPSVHSKTQYVSACTAIHVYLHFGGRAGDVNLDAGLVERRREDA